MVKRPKTPEALEDDKYYTVYKPYPLHANLEVEEDYIACARWIASCIGPNPIHALYYKPRSRGMILLEVDKAYPHPERLLGEHRWSEFLTNPTPEEVENVSQIFYSLYSRGRNAQKDGWKRIHVESVWFRNWEKFRSLIQDPYPTTYWCPTPQEDVTNKGLCRPLPVKDKVPPPRPAPPAVVGSSTWVDSKSAPSRNAPHVLKHAWRNPEPSLPQGNAWNKPIIQNNNSTQSQRPNHTNNTSTASAPASQQSTQPGDSPLGHASRTKSAPAQSTTTPVTTQPQATTPVSPGPVPSGPINNMTDRPFEEVFEKKVTITLSPSQERDLYGYDDDYDGDDDPDAFPAEFKSWGKNVAGEDAASLGLDDVGLGGEEGPPVNLWAEDKPTAPKKQAVAQCPFHKQECRKGVCQWRAKHVREEEKRKAAEAKAAAKKANSGGGGGGNGGSGSGGSARRQGGTGSRTSGGDGYSAGGRGKGRGRSSGKDDGGAGGSGHSGCLTGGRRER